jgi:hypothetical protein
VTPGRFTGFACFDWSGAAVERPPGLAFAVAGRTGPPRLIARRWSREDALELLRGLARSGEPMLIGLDLSPALPFADRDAYFPGWADGPPDARALWNLVDDLSADDPHLSAAGFLRHPEVARHFRQPGREGDLFGGGRGRLRMTERAMPGAPSSCFNLVGAAQVGKSSLTGMRVLHRLAGAIPVWPFVPVPPDGPVIVEVYPRLAALAAGVAQGRKLRTREGLTAALAALGSPDHDALAAYPDDATDAILTAAWLRAVADDPALWSPPALTPDLARTEGWTFGVR